MNFEQKAPTKLLILGDSLSASYGIPEESGWVNLLDTHLKEQHKNNPENNSLVHVVNASISGETTFGGLQRLPQLLEQHQPSHLIIELGGNDGLRGLSFDQSTDNLRQMVQLAQAENMTVLMIGVRMPPNFGAAYNRRFQQIFDQVVADTGIHYLPRFLEGVAASDPSLMQSDGIHPTAKAQPLLADKVTAAMLPILSR